MIGVRWVVGADVAHRLIGDVARASGVRHKACVRIVRGDGLVTPAGVLTARGKTYFLQDHKRCGCVIEHSAPNGRPFFTVDYSCRDCRGTGWGPCKAQEDEMATAIVLAEVPYEEALA